MIPAEPESPWQLNSQPSPDQRARPKSCARRHGVGHSGWVDRGRALAHRSVSVTLSRREGDLVSAAAQAPTSGNDTEACLFTQAQKSTERRVVTFGATTAAPWMPPPACSSCNAWHAPAPLSRRRRRPSVLAKLLVLSPDCFLLSPAPRLSIYTHADAAFLARPAGAKNQSAS